MPSAPRVPGTPARAPAGAPTIPDFPPSYPPIILNSRYLTSKHIGNILSRGEVPTVMRTATIPRDPALRLWVVLARAFDAVERHSRASIARFDLGTTEFGVLEVLYHKGRPPVCEVQR